MAIHFNCTKCSHLLQVPDEHAGRKAKCPNCGHILPVPAKSKPAAAAPPPKPPPTRIASATKAPGAEPLPVEPLAGPQAPGPIPSLATKKGRKLAKLATAKKGPPELRSGKKAVIIGVALVVVLVAAVVAWQMGVFGGKEPEEPEPTKPRRTPTPQKVVAPEPQITPEQIKAKTEGMEEQLAALQQRLEFEPLSADMAESLVLNIRSLREYTKEMPPRLLSTTDLGVQVDENEAWLYEHTLTWAQSLVSEYRFNSAKEFLGEVFAGESGTGEPTKSPARRAGSTRLAGGRQSAGQSLAEKSCRELAESELIKRGLTGEVCLWLREEADELGRKTTTISLDPPEERQSSSRPRARIPTRTELPTLPGNQTGSEAQLSGVWQQSWGPVSTHLDFIRQLQVQAEQRQNVAQAGQFYNLARELEARCISFETPGPEDADLLSQLARRRADGNQHEKIRQLIAGGHYEQALPLAKQLLEENPTNPDNHFWLLRCYFESYNARPLPIELAELRQMAQRAASLSEYELPNNLLSMGVGSGESPAALDISKYRRWGQQHSVELDKLAQYAAEYAPVVDWLKAECRTTVLQDFQFRPFLSGEPLDLLDSNGVMYTVYSLGGPPGQAALILARMPYDREGGGLYLHMADGQRYRLWSVYPPDSAAVAARGPTSKPNTEPVIAPDQVRPVDLFGQQTIPLLTSLAVLRCEQDEADWTVLIPRPAIHREQLPKEKEEPKSTRTATPVRRTDSTVPKGFRDLGGATARTTKTRTSKDPEQDRYVRLEFPSSRSSGRSSVGSEPSDSQSEPITCMIRDEQVEMAYFSDAHGKYLIGPAGRHFYATENGLLVAAGPEQSSPTLCLALDGAACPERLVKQLADYSNSAGVTNWDTGADSSAEIGGSALTISQAASWLSTVADPASSRSSRSSRLPSGSRTRRSSPGILGNSPPPVVSRWLDCNGKIMAEVNGQIVEVAQSGLIRSMFYSSADAAELLSQADEYCRLSLRTWPTLGGEVYWLINSERLAKLIGQEEQRRSGRNVRSRQPIEFDLDSEFARAGRSLVSNNTNQALAIYGDLTGFLSTKLQKGIAEDVLSASPTSRTSVGGAAPATQPSNLPFLEVDQRARQAVGGGYRRPSSRRPGGAVGGGPTLSEDEQFFADADMLIQVCLQRAAAYQQAQLPSRARQSLAEAVYRLRGYLQVEFTEWSQGRQAQGTITAMGLADIKKRWQSIPAAGLAIALQRSLQAAAGEPMTVSWPNAPNSPELSNQPAMSLAAWLAGESTGLDKSSKDSLFAVGQFDSVRALAGQIEVASSEPLEPDSQAQQIIVLLSTYQDGSKADPSIAGALWQLGSFMSAMGYPDEAWYCLGQGSAVYSRLAESLLPAAARLSSQPRQIQEKYYLYRVAALSCLAQAAALPSGGPVWPDTGSLLLAEIQSKLDQISRNWSDPAGQDSLNLMLSLADHALGSVRDPSLCSSLYEFPRMRFWWWYYPQESEFAQAAVSSRSPGARRSAQSPQPGERPKLQYTQMSPEAPPTRSRDPRGNQPPGLPPGIPMPVPGMEPPQR